MNTSTETCPPLEDLAAFLDGRLSGDERARVITHLADCPDCYEVFAEAAWFQLSEEEEEEEDADPHEVMEVPREAVLARERGQVIPFPRTPVFRWVSSIAAVLAVGLAAIPIYRQYYTMPEVRSAQLVNPTVAGKASQDRFWEDFTERGDPGEEAGIDSIPHDVLLGAHALDLHLSLGRNDRARALNDLSGINAHITEVGFLPEQAKDYAEIHRRIYEGQPASAFLQKAEEVEASLPVEDDPYFAFGKWAEAGRLAALAENPDFFQAPENRKFLRAFLHQERENLDPKVVKDLEAIRKTLADSKPASLPYQDLRRLFESILTYYQDQSEQSEPG